MWKTANHRRCDPDEGDKNLNRSDGSFLLLGDTIVQVVVRVGDKVPFVGDSYSGWRPVYLSGARHKTEHHGEIDERVPLVSDSSTVAAVSSEWRSEPPPTAA